MPPFGRRDALKLGLTSLTGAAGGVQVTPPQAAFTLAFGSCSKPKLPQPLWPDICDTRPDVWAWLGDIVYADTENIARTRALYADQAARLDYAALVAQTRVVGIWDDHDLGRNDAGAEYPKREASQNALLDFLKEPADSPRRKQRGTYASYLFGAGDRQVKLILLDARYHRERPGRESDTLGQEQWAWLAQELASSKARVNLIASGYQVLPLDHSNEKWGNFPLARHKLLELVRASRARGVALLSGDRHFAELSCLREGTRFPLYELTSSGLTHAYDGVREENRLRVGALYSHRNFGIVRIDWDQKKLTFEARARQGEIVLKHSVRLSQLGA